MPKATNESGSITTPEPIESKQADNLQQNPS